MVSADAPKFVSTVPAEVEQYGLAAAFVLAHIRFRCGRDGKGRFEREGHQWWRVSHHALGQEIGLSRKVVMGALKSLEGVVLANHFPPLDKQERAYRVASDGDARTSQSPETDRSDQPESESGHLSESGQVPVPNGTGTGPKWDSALFPQTGEKGRDTAPPPSPPSSSQPANGKPIYHPRCAKHIHDEFPPGCHGCGEARQAAEASARTAEEREAERRGEIRDAIDACQDCDPWGRLDDLSDCPQHLNFRVIAMSA